MSDRKYPIRGTSFESWFRNNLRSYASDIANHGADSGFPHISYTSDCVRLFDRFGDEIWDWAVNDAEDYGNKNVMDMISGFGRSDMAATLDGFKNLMVWYACERVARSMEDAKA